MNSGQYPVQMTRKPMQERGLKGVKNPKTPLGEPATGPSRSLRFRRSFRKSVSIYPRSAPAFYMEVNSNVNFENWGVKRVKIPFCFLMS